MDATVGGLASAVHVLGLVLLHFLWQGALVLIPFMGLYGLLDLLFVSDLPAGLISLGAILGLWALFFQLVSAEAD